MVDLSHIKVLRGMDLPADIEEELSALIAGAPQELLSTHRRDGKLIITTLIQSFSTETVIPLSRLLCIINSEFQQR